MQTYARSIDWLRLVRLLTQYIAPGLVAVALAIELLGGSNVAYNYMLVGIFTPLTVTMIAICGWTVFLWDIDRLFFKLENKIDEEVGELEPKSPDKEQDGSLLGRAREMLNNAVQNVRTKSVALIEKAYWDDINAGGVLAFPQPDIAAAVEQIDRHRRDLLAPLTELVASAVPLGSLPAAIVSRLIFSYVAPEVKVRLYRRLVLRFLSQLGALFALTAACFYISILAWSRVNGTVFSQASVVSGECPPVPARPHAARRAVRLHGAHASLGLAGHDQSERDRLCVLHAALSHVRRRLCHLVGVQGYSLRRSGAGGRC